jgi:hypothetical protein
MREGRNGVHVAKWSRAVVWAGLATISVLSSVTVAAHGMAPRDGRFLESITGPAFAPLLYLGAKHMVTGYDHLLFLVGVVFFLSRPRHILLYVSLFTLGHSATLLAGALGGYRVDAHLIDAIIGLSIVYKGFENLGGFKRLLPFQIDSRLAVLVFGLFHGLGLATKLQQFSLSSNGLVFNILSFNLGVEVGQMLALALVLIGIVWWRRRESYVRHAVVANTLLMAGGLTLTGYQLAGFYLGAP